MEDIQIKSVKERQMISNKDVPKASDLLPKIEAIIEAFNQTSSERCCKIGHVDCHANFFTLVGGGGLFRYKVFDEVMEFYKKNKYDFSFQAAGQENDDGQDIFIDW